MHVRYTDETELTCCGRPDSGWLEPPPWARQITIPGADVRTLLDRLDRESEGRSRRVIEEHEFGALAERCWARGYAWRSVRGVNIAEMKKVVGGYRAERAEERGILHRIKAERTWGARMDFRHALLMEAVRQELVTMDQARALRHHLEVVHEFTTAEVAIRIIRLRLNDRAFTTDIDGAGLEVFERINATLSQERQFQRVLRMTHPLDADLYVAPVPDAN